MKKFCGALLIGFVVLGLRAQDVVLPTDFRQQNLTEYNGSLLNPAYSLGRNNPSSIAMWARWQWQTYDADPTSLFINYTANINEVSAAGVGFFQHNTGIYLNTGAALNYAYNIQLDEDVFLGVGLNLFAFQQKLADQRFFVPNPIQTTISNDFIIQMAPGINLRVDKFNIGLVSENLFDYNLSTNERNSDPGDRMFFALASYDIPISILNGDDNSVLRPSLYYKTVPGVDNQLGLQALLTTNKYWVQGGYNSFYGISGGVGGRFFKRLSIGALVEVGTSNDLKGQDPSFELVTSYKLGKLQSTEDQLEEELIAAQKEKEELVKDELTRAEKLAVKREAKKQDRLEKLQAQRIQDSISESTRLAEAEEKISKRDLRKMRDSIAEAKAAQALADARALDQKRKQDSIALDMRQKEEALAALQQQKQDSIAKANAAIAEAEQLAARNEVVQPRAGEKYEEVEKEGSLTPGYYLIANVFGTKKYLDAFMADMGKKGLNPKSFYRSLNKYNYVYLGKYNTIKEARQARDSKLNGRYTEKLWIFRVTGK
ncbi:type IX secretion system membrane protein, PorP/SprF family [Maribacter sedimenticola]|uniref:Type IX secretion system membrane protein, PorP/SprF family n=1 Tax=Maribacter sedimenticola TaxID=228956 RepID=A0ABY1SGR4_9FLAO|nr:PorP/SprF family type IX secretion system membrane protein [Maribacter sedimenticola]SNR44329.1 type IX secretion system membrane protein, PorP/SprF family [Maribacter sedimenticola]